MSPRLSVSLGILSILILLASLGNQSSSPVQAQGDDGVRTARHPQTGKLSFLGFDPRSAIQLISPQVAESMARQDIAMAALHRFGAEFGLVEPGRELQLLRSPAEGEGGSVRYQQLHKGIPILAGELIVNLDEQGRLRAIVGEVSPDLDLSIDPQVDPGDAREQALSVVARAGGIEEGQLDASEGALWVYDERLLRPSSQPPRLVWRFEVTLNRAGPVRHLVLVDAQRGNVLLEFNQVDMAKNRSVYDNNNDPSLSLPGAGPYRTEGGPVSGISDVNNAYDFSGDTYDFYFSYHGRDSVDNAGMALISTTRFCDPLYPCPFDNAFWNGEQMVYGEGHAGADDVVAHELTHGVTENESNLFYYYQSGAMNESLSDLWGEFVDQVNGAGTDTASVKWLMGEDIPGGAIRSMSDPTIYGDPDKISSPYYYEGPADNGGVHWNSGVNNKAVYLMTDGGSFNGQTISPLGLAKVAAIYYEGQTDLLTSGADYLNLYESLYQACLNLIGGSEGITGADCNEVRQATEAVEMNQQPSLDFNTEADFCPSAGTPVFSFFDDFENGTDAWDSASTTGTDRWTYGSIYGPYSTSGEWMLFADDYPDAVTDTYSVMNSGVVIPAGGYLHFAHAYGFEDSSGTFYDGGVLEFSSNGGSWTDAGSLIEVNGYNGTIYASFDNPLAGRQGFTGDSHGYISSRLNLGSLEGDSVRFRWRMGLDSVVYDWGWWLDDVAIYWCATNALYLPIIER